MPDKEIVKKYTNGEITIVWQPAICAHSTICWRGKDGLREVFNPGEKPWIKPEGATTQQITDQIDKCPSGALSYYRNEGIDETGNEQSGSLVEMRKDGPLLVHGNVVVRDHEGNETQKSKITAFCRCGASGNKPYCDGSHLKIGFEG